MSSAIARVVISGASSGIGLDAARRFLSAGSSLIINASNAQKLERAARSLEGGERVLAVPGDIAAPETAARVAEAARQRWGGVDVLINSAGIFAAKPFLETTPADLDRFLSVNLKGTFQMTQATVPLMIAAGAGSIINLGTVLVSQGRLDLPISAAMSSKGGVHALTVSLAAELARYSIRVNTLAPGIIRTPLIGDAADSFRSWHPLGRIGEVLDTSEAAFYLATADFVTGTVLDVDGGYAHAR